MPARVRRWLVQSALPLWANAGVDAEKGGFTERLMLDGHPDFTVPKRLRVQARQIYVFSHAKILGLMPDGDAVAAQGFDFVMRNGCPEGVAAGFVHALTRDGVVLDDKRDTYDHAFLLFAFSWFYRATGRADVRDTIMALGDAIWAVLRHPGGEGFIVDTTRTDALHQNPHMHLFEALLAAHDATQEGIFLERAGELFGVFRTRMFDREFGVIREFYDSSWQPAAGDAGRIVEPGHHCEWVWLLKWYADSVGEPLCEEAFRLYDFVERHKQRSGKTLLCDELWIGGTVKRSSTRSWPQTEAIKAEIALAAAHGIPAGPRTDTIVGALFDTFLDRTVPGAWLDWVDAEDRALVHAIPASSFYHVFLSFSEYLRVREA